MYCVAGCWTASSGHWTRARSARCCSSRPVRDSERTRHSDSTNTILHRLGVITIRLPRPETSRFLPMPDLHCSSLTRLRRQAVRASGRQVPGPLQSNRWGRWRSSRAGQASSAHTVVRGVVSQDWGTHTNISAVTKMNP